MADGSLPLIRPMLATLSDLPQPPGWGYEFKWDGIRALTRNDRDVTAAYPELRTLLDRFGRRRAILDGEIVALDPKGRPSFSLLQQRMHVHAPTAALLARVPVQLYLFDLLYQGTRPLVDLPYRRRRHLLDDLALTDEVTKTPPYWADDAGKDLMHAGQLRPLQRAASPFDLPVPREHSRGVHWVEPRLVGEVSYRTRTPDGRLRHPSWRGLRPDRQPRDARRLM